jgi:hypothetical protein
MRDTSHQTAVLGVEYLPQMIRIRGFHKQIVEPGTNESSPIFIPAISGNGDQYRSPHGRLADQATGQFASVHFG